eukprot:COSAG01_NODE_45006_length_413_cov_1.910828_1_plen_30_part_01
MAVSAALGKMPRLIPQERRAKAAPVSQSAS